MLNTIAKVEFYSYLSEYSTDIPALSYYLVILQLVHRNTDFMKVILSRVVFIVCVIWQRCLWKIQ